MTFWGCAVKPGKEAPFVPSPEADEKLHISQACLAPGAPKNARATLMLRVGESEEAFAVAALRESGTECVSLDIVLDQYTEFTVQGNAQIHITGYYMPEYAIDGEDGDDEDDEHVHGQILGYDEYGVPVMADEYDSEEDSDYESEEGEEGSEDDFDDEDEDSDLDALLQSLARKSNVTIEDITETEKLKSAKKALPALPAPASANGKKAKVEDFSDDDVEGSDEEESEEESEDEIPAPKSVKGKQAAAVAATPASAAAKGQKRKAEEPVAKSAQKSVKKEDKKEIKKKEDDKVAAGQVASGNKRVRRFANGFEIEDLKVGPANGKLAKPGKKVVVKYVGKLKNGKVFDQTTGNKTFSFLIHTVNDDGIRG